MIALRGLKKMYGKDTVPLRGIDLTIGDGDVIAVIGPSGTGKSTLLRCIDMLTVPTEGRIIVDGEDITAPGCDLNEVRKKIGMVFQSFNLFMHLTVIENVMDPQVTLLGRSRQEAYEKAVYLLDQVGLRSRMLSYPAELSGGQQQRAAIARTLAMDPEIILFDEPTSALDPGMVGEVQSVIRMLASAGHTMMIVTHEMDFARKTADRVLFMYDGIIYEQGTPEEIFSHPKREMTRKFIERLSVLTYEIGSPDWDMDTMRKELDSYGEKLLIEAERLSKLMMAVEAVCIDGIASSADGPGVTARVEYSEKSDVLSLTVRYSGERFDCASSSSLRFLHLLGEPTTELSYEESDGTSACWEHGIVLRFRWQEGT